MVARSRSGALAGLALGSAVFASACASDLPPPQPRPARGSIGEETFGVFCDRVGAQSLHEDLSGDSFVHVCHRDPATGDFAGTVDRSALPPIPASAPPSAAQDRARGVARVEALARHRADLVAALDAVVPASATVLSRSGAPGGGCTNGEPKALSSELAAVLARLSDAYDDGTVPQATRSLGRLMDAFKASPAAQAALQRTNKRTGYRPESVALGIARPVLAYPGLRDMANATLRLVSPDGPGPQYPKLQALAHTSRLELANATASPHQPPLVTAQDDAVGIARLSRPRTILELLSRIMSTEDAAFGGGAPRYVVRRDVRGMAVVAAPGGAVPSPFVDANGDGLPDVDAAGEFVTSTGAPAPSPFLAPQRTGDVTPRDASGRALDGSGRLVYDFIDTSHVYAASVVKNLLPMVNPDPAAKHETLMDALAGAYVVVGPELGAPTAQKTYADGTTLAYAGFDASRSPLVDLVYAVGQTLADSSTDGALAATAWLFANDEADLAEAVDAALRIKKTSDAHPEAALQPTSMVWDDLVEVLAQIADVSDDAGHPVLLEEMLAGLADPAAANLSSILVPLVSNRDAIDYDRRDVNGPPMNVSAAAPGAAPRTPVDRAAKDAGPNRSVLQRFLALIHDTRGVSVCNRPGARVEAHMTVPVFGGTIDVSIPDSPLVEPFWGKSSFGECEVFKMDDMATFYVEAIVGQAQYVLRDKLLRDGLPIDPADTATTVQLLEASSALTGHQPPGTTDPAARTGFWTPPSSKLLMTRPEWLNRNLFLGNGYAGPNGDVPIPARANAFSKALNPDHAGTSVCPKRAVADPLPPTDPNYTPGGTIHLPDCKDGDWLDQRDAQTIFALETVGFYPAIAPLVRPFVAHGHPELLVALLDALHRHYASDADGVVRYEPILADAFASNLLPALQSTVRTLAAQGAVFHVACPKLGAACAGEPVDGVRALAVAIRAAVDPNVAAARGLIDRAGRVTATRSDGSVKPQVTPIDLLTAALASIDRAFADYAAAHPHDTGRLAQWRSARSQLVDQFLTVDAPQATGGTYRFRDRALPRFVPLVTGTLRQQLWAQCTEWPAITCAWAGHDLAKSAADAVGSPLAAHGADLLDALRQDAGARVELEKLLSYLLDESSSSDALASLLAASADGMQVLQDEADLAPILQAIAPAMAASPDGDRGLVDAQVALLTRLTARSFDGSGVEQCGGELDPSQALTAVLSNAVTPTTLPGGRTMTPVEVVLDAIGDVNRARPDETGPLSQGDYASVADEVSRFLLDPQRGLEQFYAICENAR